MSDFGDGVYWSEGMFLRPVDFQLEQYLVQERLRSGLIRARSSAWGVVSFDYSAADLGQGKLTVTSLELVFPDGTDLTGPRRLTDADLPEFLLDPHLSSLPADAELIVSAALPKWALGSRNVDDEGEGASEGARRYTVAEPKVFEFGQGDKDYGVRVLRPQVRLTCHSTIDESLDGNWLRVPLLRLQKGQGGAPEPSRDFIPPAFDLVSAPRLQSALQDLVTNVTTKAMEVARERKPPSEHELTSREIVHLLLLALLNRAEARFGHLSSQGRAHPEDLFVALSEFRGEMASYGVSGRPVKHVRYVHADPWPGFETLFEEIDRFIRIMVETRVVTYPFQAQEEEGGRRCGDCGAPNPPEARSCVDCGWPDIVEGSAGESTGVPIHVSSVAERHLGLENKFVLEIISPANLSEVRRAVRQAGVKLGPASEMPRLVRTQQPSLVMEEVEGNQVPGIRPNERHALFYVIATEDSVRPVKAWNELSSRNKLSVSCEGSLVVEQFNLHVITPSRGTGK